MTPDTPAVTPFPRRTSRPAGRADQALCALRALRANRARHARHARRAATTAAAALAVALLASACGSSSKGAAPSGPPLQVVQTAADKTVASGTAQAALVLKADFSGLPQDAAATSQNGSFEIDATGAFDLAAHRSRLDVDLSKLPAATRNRFHGSHLVMLIDQGTVYVPSAAVGLSSAKPWIKLDSSNLGGSGTLDFSQLSQFGPAQVLDLLKQFGSVTVAGHDTIRGAATTHYHAVVELAKMLGSLGGNQQTGSAAGLFGAIVGNATVPVDVWIDGADHLRKVTTQIDLLPLLKALGGIFNFGGEASTTTTLPPSAKALIGMSFELFDFGAKVDVAPPPADQVGPPPPGFTLSKA